MCHEIHERLPCKDEAIVSIDGVVLRLVFPCVMFPCVMSTFPQVMTVPIVCTLDLGGHSLSHLPESNAPLNHEMKFAGRHVVRP